MAYDQSTRNRLQKFVSEARAILTEEFTRQLQATYGIDPNNGTVAPVAALHFLDNQGRETAFILRETLAHYLAATPGKSEKERTRPALDRIIREQAFTVLNRLSALRMAEARGFLIESIAKGYRSKGFQLYKNLAGTALGETGEAYCQYLFSLFDEFSLELAVLFDRHSVQGRLFPRETALLALLEQINQPEIEPLWAEDETIGWIYQYFNSQEERKKMRAESQAPRNSRELAVRNQFFTPRYVVEFLTDNTLGRIWYEMTQGKTALVDSCRYLVRRPTEIFLAKGEAAPEENGEKEESLSQEELLKQPVYIPFRQRKDPREIRMLDPACGSMHFGLYAFDLFEKIYEEAWQSETELGPAACERSAERQPLQAAYASFDAFRKAIPKLIIEQNIHGVDIDPRAVQIAGLSLWLRAQRAWHQMGVKPDQRPPIKKSNVVCAEPMPGEKELLQEFTARLNPPVLGELVEFIFDKMALAGEAGTLLKIEEEIKTAISDKKADFEKELALKKKDESYLPGLAPERDFKLVTDEQLLSADFWETAEERILAALREYADQAESSNEQKRMFAEDAAKGFAFIDICRKRFDVVLMNPPFGALASSSKQQLYKAYPLSKNDLLSIFVERGLELLRPGGRIGAITSRTCFFLSSFKKWRKKVVLGIGRTEVMADLGFGVMDDAMVEAAAYVLVKDDDESSAKTTFLRLLADKNKTDNLPATCHAFRANEKDNRIFRVTPDSFLAVPGAPFAYWISNTVRAIFKKLPSFESEKLTARQGLATAEDFRFVRSWWEQPGTGWYGFAKGGTFSPFYADIYLMTNWFYDGAEIKAGICNRYPYLNGNAEFVAKNPQFYLRPGLTWPRRTNGLSFRAMPQGCIFADKGPAIFVTDDAIDTLLALLALINSKAFGFLISVQLARTELAQSYEVGIIQKTPIPNLSMEHETSLAALARRAWSLKRTLDTIEETSHAFLLPAILRSRLNNYIPSAIEEELACIQDEINDLAFELYGFSENDRALALQSQEVNADSVEGSEDNDRYENSAAPDQIAGLLSWAMGVAFGRFDWRLATGERTAPIEPEPFDPLPTLSPGMLPVGSEFFQEHKGILPDDPNHPNDLAQMMEKVLTRVDAPIPSDVRRWLQRECFDQHLKSYSKSHRSAPIFWPLSTGSSSFTLWVYYHRLTEQTLYACVNDFVEPKLKTVADDLNGLRNKSARSSAEEKEFSRLSDLEAELKDFREELLRLAKFWKPNLNDGVQITAAPLWKLFQHKQWQKKLKETWEKLERGEYDWAHLAYSIWPERVLRKCHQDRSLAIAHEVEADFWEAVAVPGKKGQTKSVWQPKKLDEEQLNELIRGKIEAVKFTG